MKRTETYMVVVDDKGLPIHETMTPIPKVEKDMTVDRAEGIAFVKSTEMFVLILNEMLKMPKLSIIQMSQIWGQMEKAGYRVHKMNVTFDPVGEPYNSIDVSKKVLANLPTDTLDLHLYLLSAVTGFVVPDCVRCLTSS